MVFTHFHIQGCREHEMTSFENVCIAIIVIKKCLDTLKAKRSPNFIYTIKSKNSTLKMYLKIFNVSIYRSIEI